MTVPFACRKAETLSPRPRLLVLQERGEKPTGVVGTPGGIPYYRSLISAIISPFGSRMTAQLSRSYDMNRYLMFYTGASRHFAIS